MWKKIVVLVVALLIFAATGASAAVVRITFAWDANSETDLAGYRLYSSYQQGQYTKGNYIQQVGLATTCQEEIEIDIGEVFYFVLTAFDTEGNESEFSNEVSFFLQDGSPGIAPAAPTFRIQSWEAVSSNP